MKITVNGAELFFDTAGSALAPDARGMREKPVLLMLHGGPGYDQMTLRPYFDRYADAFQVIYLDHRGCGRSTGGPEGWRLDQWADDVAGFCAALGVSRPVIFGQSFGGMVAMQVAARHPALPARLILSSTAARFRLDATVEKARALGGDTAADVARDFFTTPTLASYETYNRVCLPLYNGARASGGAAIKSRSIERPEVAIHFFAGEMKQMDLRSGIEGLSCPTLVLAGGEDPVTPPICSEEIAAAIGPAAQLEFFPACGHGVHRDDPDGAERVMRAFLDGI